MNRLTKWIVLGVGGFIVSALITIYAYPAVQTVAGLAVAQTSTTWNSVKDLAVGDNMINGVLAAGVVVFDGTNFDRVRGDTTNGLDVDVTRVSGTVTIAGASTPADGFANPTTAVNTWALLGGFNGTTWDRLISHGTNADAEATRTAGALEVDAHLRGWNGTTFDRVRALANNADDVAVSTTGNLSVQSFGYEFDGTTYDRIRNQFTQSTTGVTTNAAGTTLVMTTTPMSKFTMVIDRTAGSTNPVEVDLQCSLDGSIWVQVGTITDLTNEPVLTSVDGNPCADIRYNVVTVGAGNTLTIQLLATR
jgi:hypothetical protein